MFYRFRVDQPATVRLSGVTATTIWRTKFDAYADWKINPGTSPSAWSAAGRTRRKAAQQSFGRRKNFAYGMLFLAYSY